MIWTPFLYAKLKVFSRLQTPIIVHFSKSNQDALWMHSSCAAVETQGSIDRGKGGESSWDTVSNNKFEHLG